jgi:6-phosphogluconolactonase
MLKKLFFTFLLPAVLLSVTNSKVVAQQYYLFAGTYTSGSSDGIYVYKFDAGTGKITPVDTAKNIDNPSYLTLSRDGKFLYAVNESGGKKPGQISSFSFDAVTGKLKLLNQRGSLGDYPCYITVSDNRKWAIAGNYGGGNLVAYAIAPDGSLSDNKQLITHTGKSLTVGGQETSHVHSTMLSPDKKFLLVPDLGLDKVMIYQFSESSRENPLKAANPPYAAVTEGSGPRHLAFHPNGKWVYLIQEMSGKVNAFNYKQGTLTSFQEIDGHQQNYSGRRGSADIHVSPDGKFLYSSNRFEANNLAIFKIDQSTGKLSVAGFQGVIGEKPRNFIIEPSGKFLLVANQETNDIRFFIRNPDTGLLRQSETVIKVGNPVCLQLLPIK